MTKCFILKRCFIQKSPTKTILAALAAAAMLLAPAPARANTAWVRGGNWAFFGGDPYNILYPCGITNTTTLAEAASVADTIALQEGSLGINFVRYPIDPATVSSSTQWPVTQAAINELIADGMKVDICCWYIDSTTGQIPSYNNWETMWQTVDGVYKNNSAVYYEPINEPHGYTTASSLEVNVYNPFLTSYGIQKGQGYIILDGTGYADNVTNIGDWVVAQNYSCTLAVHDYAMWSTGNLTEAKWETQFQGAVGNYSGRTIMTEFGAETSSGLDYDVSSTTDYNISFIRAMAIKCRAWGMGSCYFPVHQDSHNTKRLFEGLTGIIYSRSLVNQLQYEWDYYSSSAVWGICDFNVNGTTDYSIYRPSDHTWSFKAGGGGGWGATGDIAVPADYAGAGTAQMATWRPSNFTWYLDGVSGGGAWGTTGDIPVPADYNGTGQAQLTTWRPSNGNWYVNGGGGGHWGTNGDIPVPGYYNGDGHADMAVYRPSNCTWFINGGATVQFGISGDVPVPGDYDGSGTTQIAVWRPSNGTWYVHGGATVQFGTNGDVPVPGDYTGSGATQMAVWRPSNNTWFVYGVGQTAWGTTGDVPLPLPYAIRHYSLGYSN